MKKTTLSFLLAISLFLISLTSTAQDSLRTADRSLNGQYQEMLRRSWTQQGYKVVHPSRLSALWKSVQDSLRAERKKSPQLRQQVDEQRQTIEELKKQVATHQANLEKSEAAVNEVQLLGMSVDKVTYNSIMWGIVAVLALALAIVVFTAGKSVREARYRRQLYDELSTEYQAYKVKANDKEKKLARELQTERNKIEELLNKG
ncbi:hypothetical protein [Pedobacter sp. SYSU D00535]|uniref:hypothetical protein n=1 Tax=Pedobacter sp. SYSU D00535 TaxID=2810308 RepID=UPI001A97BAE7|nr:hypothetical protein [Pedobacter sp. SYSU D00535]